MKVYLKAGGQLRQMIKPDIDHYTRLIEFDGEKTLAEILRLVPLDPAFIAFIYIESKIRDLSYKPTDGQVITLQPPVSGG
jgi:hypothetical protein